MAGGYICLHFLDTFKALRVSIGGRRFRRRPPVETMRALKMFAECQTNVRRTFFRHVLEMFGHVFDMFLHVLTCF